MYNINVKKIAVIGYGSTLRSDDRAGIDAVKALRRLYKKGTQVQFFEGYSAVDLLELFGQFECMILVDTGNIGKPPGGFVRLTLEKAKLRDENVLFTHNVNFKAMLDVARQLNLSVPKIVFYLIQPANLGIGEKLTKEVADGVKKMVKEIDKHIRALLREC